MKTQKLYFRAMKSLLINLLWGIFVLVSCGNGNLNQPKLSQDMIEATMKRNHIPGASIAIIYNFKIVSVKHYGVMDAESQKPVTDQTLFQAASISKAISALAILKQVQEGKLSLDENINTALKSWQLPDNKNTHPVTLRHLLSHTGGINIDGFAGYDRSKPYPSILDILNGGSQSGLKPVRIIKTPGKQFLYSGGGFCIMEQAMTDITKKDFRQLMQQTVFDKLGMKNSYFTTSVTNNDHLAHGHDKTGKVIPGEWSIYPVAAGGVVTTAEDLAKVLVEIQLSLNNQSNKILNQQMTNEMLKPFNNPIYGLGFYLDGNGDYFSHNGNNVGFQTNMIAHRKNGYGVVVLTNSDNGKYLIKEVFKAVSAEYNWNGFPCR